MLGPVWLEGDMAEDRKATDRLANERTYLAWVRTAVAIMGLGFVVAKFGLWLRELAAQSSPGLLQQQGSGASAPLGAAIIGFGGALALLAARRFQQVNREIEAGAVKPARGLVLLLTVAMAVLALVMVAYIRTTAVHPS